jgi:hypothetical protein
MPAQSSSVAEGEREGGREGGRKVGREAGSEQTSESERQTDRGGKGKGCGAEREREGEKENIHTKDVRRQAFDEILVGKGCGCRTLLALAARHLVHLCKGDFARRHELGCAVALVCGVACVEILGCQVGMH